MFAVSVVEYFDIFEDVGTQLGLIGKDVIAHCGGFITAIKRFHRRVVIAVALTAHAEVHFQPSQQSLVVVTGVGAASITVIGFAQLLEQVRVVAIQVVAVGAHRLESRLVIAHQRQLVHQAQRAFPAAVDSLIAQMLMDRAKAIGTREPIGLPLGFML